jgi:hypothetical protein
VPIPAICWGPDRFRRAEHCPLHLPLASPQKLARHEFKQMLNKLQEQGNRDFSCTAIVGAPNRQSTFNYGEMLGDCYRNCDVDANVQIILSRPADWSQSRFHGDVFLVPGPHFKCDKGFVEGNIDFHCNGEGVCSILASLSFKLDVISFPYIH